MSHKHHEAVEHLDFGISNRQGFVVITGDVGAGKTTLCRSLLTRLDEGVKTALVLNPTLSPLELLQTINEDLGLEHEDNSRKRLTKALNDFLLKQFEIGGNVVVIVDEAHKLSEESLEQIRLLSNLETAKEKLIQIVLVGQPDLSDVLSRPSMTPLAQRVAVRYHIGPLDFSETSQYIAHRLRVAGAHLDIFDSGAIKKIFRHSGGIPRKINLVCDKSMLCAYGTNENRVKVAHVRAALKEIGIQHAESTGVIGRALLRIGVPAAAAILAALLVGWVLTSGRLGIYRSEVGHKEPASAAARGPAREGALFGGQADESPIASSKSWAQFDDSGVFRVESEQLALAGAVATVLRLWGEDISKFYSRDEFERATTLSDVRIMMTGIGFRLESHRARISRLIQLDVPCLALLTPETGVAPRYCALVGYDGKAAIVADSIDGLLRLHSTVLDKRSNSRAIYILPDLDGLRRPLRSGKRGPDVAAFRARLFNLGFLGGSRSDEYDAECARAVREFQLSCGLSADGIAGWRTMVVVCREIMTTRVARLSAWAPRRRDI
ncbi:AAA family ATPase [bacterium]|nr:AAA family ATPase [bacterium]